MRQESSCFSTSGIVTSLPGQSERHLLWECFQQGLAEKTRAIAVKGLIRCERKSGSSNSSNSKTVFVPGRSSQRKHPQLRTEPRSTSKRWSWYTLWCLAGTLRTSEPKAQKRNDSGDAEGDRSESKIRTNNSVQSKMFLQLYFQIPKLHILNALSTSQSKYKRPSAVRVEPTSRRSQEIPATQTEEFPVGSVNSPVHIQPSAVGIWMAQLMECLWNMW